mmetsp:Transcript_63317/g.185112  ORF Transcript_63317/g.185112 Transcript_63317/m.185112 type:complete len:261 (+) Transcript_63317:530-1312(+)
MLLLSLSPHMQLLLLSSWRASAAPRGRAGPASLARAVTWQSRQGSPAPSEDLAPSSRTGTSPPEADFTRRRRASQRGPSLPRHRSLQARKRAASSSDAMLLRKSAPPETTGAGGGRSSLSLGEQAATRRSGESWKVAWPALSKSRVAARSWSSSRRMPMDHLIPRAMSQWRSRRQPMTTATTTVSEAANSAKLVRVLRSSSASTSTLAPSPELSGAAASRTRDSIWLQPCGCNSWLHPCGCKNRAWLLLITTKPSGMNVL